MQGLCPHCENVVSKVNVAEIEIATGWLSASARGVTYSCSACNHVLSVGIDPLALKSELLDEIKAALRKK